jgi:5-(aminomethyl)-3-furanmethanol phosphate kinase
MRRPFVMKIGGSLIDQVPGIARALLSSTCPALIIPGGGPFTDLVRTLNATDKESHWMAILGMEQYGWYIASFGIRPGHDLQVPEHPTVLLPYALMQKEDPLPHTWDITSDTIAAWVAHCLGLDLVILKSVDGIMNGGLMIEQITAPIPCEEVDPGFIRFVLDHGVRTLIMNGRTIERVRGLLRGEQVEGTRIGTTF